MRSLVTGQPPFPANKPARCLTPSFGGAGDDGRCSEVTCLRWCLGYPSSHEKLYRSWTSVNPDKNDRAHPVFFGPSIRLVGSSHWLVRWAVCTLTDVLRLGLELQPYRTDEALSLWLAMLRCV
ncbi:hypothetical protein BC629DRAFT_419856 [Irpex lacteus]|nr:hypothetical protein BC629DRAFT_419856 [Irpex lacteus]